MKNIAKNALYASLATTTAGLTATHAAITTNPVQDNITWVTGTADTAIQDLVGTLFLYLGLLAVLYGLWGGFQILTAGGDEDKVKKGKTILVQVAIWIVVIFLANSIVTWVLGLF